MTPAIGAWLYVMLLVFAVVLVICWIVLPFAVIGLKPVLRDLMREQRRTNELLGHLTGHALPDPRLGPGDIQRDAAPPTAPVRRFTGSANLPPV